MQAACVARMLCCAVNIVDLFSYHPFQAAEALAEKVIQGRCHYSLASQEAPGLGPSLVVGHMHVRVHVGICANQDTHKPGCTTLVGQGSVAAPGSSLKCGASS